MKGICSPRSPSVASRRVFIYSILTVSCTVHAHIAFKHLNKPWAGPAPRGLVCRPETTGPEHRWWSMFFFFSFYSVSCNRFCTIKLREKSVLFPTATVDSLALKREQGNWGRCWVPPVAARCRQILPAGMSLLSGVIQTTAGGFQV